MPKGEPNKNTIRVERYQKKIGYRAKSYKLDEKIADAFKMKCIENGVAQAAIISKLMQGYIDGTIKLD